MIAICNGNVVLEHKILRDGVVLVDENRILAVGSAEEVAIPETAEVYDAQGLYIGPGFVDIHVHGGNGHFLYAEPTAAAAHFLKHGETTVLVALYYDLSKEDFLEAIQRVKEVMEDDSTKNIAGFYME